MLNVVFIYFWIFEICRYGEVITLSHFIHLLRELKPGWNPMQFLLQGGQLIAEQANDAKKLAVKTAKKLAATASQKVETTINNINKDNEDWHKGT